MDNLKRRLEACKGEPDWATFPLDESLLQDMPPLSAEARADHEQGMNFFKRLEEGLENNPETQGAMKKLFTPIRSVESLAESNRVLDECVQYLHDHGLHDLAAEYPLWLNRGTKRLKGIPPEEPLDDRPIIYFQDPLLWGHEASLIRKPSASQEEAERDGQGDGEEGKRDGEQGGRDGEERGQERDEGGDSGQGGREIRDGPAEDTAAEAGKSG